MVWVGDYSLKERVVTLRYFLFTISGFVAFVTPYLLFPDSNTASIQLGNLRGKNMMKYLVFKLWKFHWPLILLFVIILFGDIQTPFDNLVEKSIYAGYSILFFIGLNLISLPRYLQSGMDSQFWQESEKGRDMRKKFADYFKYPLDPGSIPSLINTLIVTGIGMITIVIAASAADIFNPLIELLIGSLIVMVGFRMLMKSAVNPEQSFYSTNAFYRDFFGSDPEGEHVVERRKVDQLWWVPSKIRANVWQFLQQIDRKIPAGRAVAIGHFFIWFMAYQRPSEEFITALWIFFALAHQLFIMLTLQPSMAPGWLLRWIGSEMNWFFSRIWMQLRWLVPLTVSMNVQLFIFGLPGWSEQLFVISVFLISAIIVSGVGVVQLKRDLK